MGNSIPKTISETFKILDAVLSEDEKADILAQSKSDFTIGVIMDTHVIPSRI